MSRNVAELFRPSLDMGMQTIHLKMWDWKKKILLVDILSMLPKVSISHWVVYEFYGTGVAPDGLGMVEFEEIISKSPSGYHLSDAELRDFSAGILDIYDIYLRGFSEDTEVISIKGVDSDYWEITGEEDTVARIGGAYPTSGQSL